MDSSNSSRVKTEEAEWDMLFRHLTNRIKVWKRS